MADYRTDEEQVEIIKDWWKKNGISTVVMVLLAIGAYAGGQFYRENNDSYAEQATSEYDLMLAELDQNKRKEAVDRGQRILELFDDTVQSANTSLILAKIAVEDGQLDTAAKLLTRVKDQAPLPSIQNVARVRLARVLSQQKKYDIALKLLDDGDSGKLLGIFEEIKGDIYLAKGDIEKAKAAYNRSLQVEPTSIRQPVLRMKLEDLNTAADNAKAS